MSKRGRLFQAALSASLLEQGIDADVRPAPRTFDRESVSVRLGARTVSVPTDGSAVPGPEGLRLKDHRKVVAAVLAAAEHAA